MTPREPSGSAATPAAATPSSRRRRPVRREMVTSDHNDGWMMAVELVGGTFTWGGIGYLIDRFWLHTEPVFMSIGFVVGFFAGMYLLWLHTSQPIETPPGSGTTKATTAGGGNGAGT